MHLMFTRCCNILYYVPDHLFQACTPLALGILSESLTVPKIMPIYVGSYLELCLNA